MARSLGLDLLVVLGTVGCGSDDSPEAPSGPIAAHVDHYDVTFDLATRHTTMTLTATASVGGDCFTLPFRATELGPDAAFAGEAATSATVAGDAITVCGAGVEPGATFTMTTSYVIAEATLEDSQVGYSVRNDSDGNAFHYLVSWVGGCDRFGPCDNRPDQFATFRFTIEHPADLTVACAGALTQPTPTETVCDFTHDGGPTYSTFGLAAYPAWTVTDKGTWSGVKVSVYDRASTGITAAIDPAYHAGFIDFMQAHFGPYPYGDELRILTAPTYWNGFEHPGNIVLADTLAHQFRPVYLHNTAHILDHEMAHQWAGDQTTLADTYDFAWKESMAEYLPFVYESETEPAAGRKTAGYWKSASVGSRYWVAPADQPALFDYYGDVYGPGPMVFFRQLEAMTSRAQVLAGIASVLGTAHALSIDELVAALSMSTGVDLTAYAAAWIHGSGAPVWPTYTATYTDGATAGAPGTLQLTRQNPEAGPRPCVFHVQLRSADGLATQDVRVDTWHGAMDQTISVPAPTFTVDTTVLDPDSECLVYRAVSGVTAPAPHRNPWRTYR